MKKITENAQIRFYNENLTTDKYIKQLQITGKEIIVIEIGERTLPIVGTKTI